MLTFRPNLSNRDHVLAKWLFDHGWDDTRKLLNVNVYIGCSEMIAVAIFDESRCTYQTYIMEND